MVLKMGGPEAPLGLTEMVSPAASAVAAGIAVPLAGFLQEETDWTAPQIMLTLWGSLFLLVALYSISSRWRPGQPRYKIFQLVVLSILITIPAGLTALGFAG